jgi:hypothetical protein
VNILLSMMILGVGTGRFRLILAKLYTQPEPIGLEKSYSLSGLKSPYWPGFGYGEAGRFLSFYFFLFFFFFFFSFFIVEGVKAENGAKANSRLLPPVAGKCDVYIGLVFTMSHEPSSLLLQSFSKNKQVLVIINDSATKDLRLLLQLDL